MPHAGMRVGVRRAKILGVTLTPLGSGPFSLTFDIAPDAGTVGRSGGTTVMGIAVSQSVAGANSYGSESLIGTYTSQASRPTDTANGTRSWTTFRVDVSAYIDPTKDHRFRVYYTNGSDTTQMRRFFVSNGAKRVFYGEHPYAASYSEAPLDPGSLFAQGAGNAQIYNVSTHAFEDTGSAGSYIYLRSSGVSYAGVPYNQGSTKTFSDAGLAQAFYVPNGVTSLSFDGKGASGGYYSTNTPGKGGRIQGTIAVTPGELLIVKVGGAGTSLGYTTADQKGGYNGGGTGHGTGGPGGGGATELLRGSTTLFIAGGGGATGAGGPNNPADIAGGDGGGVTGSAGVTNLATPGSTPGQGGTQSAGGAAGMYATAGSRGQGGDGANTGASAYNGGGGGGGYYGGGGGGFGGGNSGSSGAGGGSSYADPSATGVTNTAGVNAGDGVAVLSW